MNGWLPDTGTRKLNCTPILNFVVSICGLVSCWKVWTAVFHCFMSRSVLSRSEYSFRFIWQYEAHFSASKTIEVVHWCCTTIKQGRVVHTTPCISHREECLFLYKGVQKHDHNQSGALLTLFRSPWQKGVLNYSKPFSPVIAFKLWLWLPRAQNNNE